MDSNNDFSSYAGIYRWVVHRGEKPPMYWIGQAKCLRAREKSHRKGLRLRNNSLKLQNAYNKYGADAFTFEILLVCERKAGVLTMYEQLVVDSYPPSLLYNVHIKCVNSPLGRKMPPSVGLATSKRFKGKKQPPEQVANVSAALMNHETKPETKAKISAKLTGQKHSPERRAAQSAGQIGRKAWHKGRKFALDDPSKPGPKKGTPSPLKGKPGKKPSPELVEKRVAKQRGQKRNFTPEHRAALSIGTSGPRSEAQLEHLVKLSEGNVGRKYSPIRNARIAWSKYKDKVGIWVLECS